MRGQNSHYAATQHQVPETANQDKADTRLHIVLDTHWLAATEPLGRHACSRWMQILPGVAVDHSIYSPSLQHCASSACSILKPSPTLTPPRVLICADLPLHMQPSCMAVVPKLAGCLTMSARHPKTTAAIMHGCSTASAAGSVQPL